MFKYSPLYADGRLPIIEEQDVYSVTIPIEPIIEDEGLSQGLSGDQVEKLALSQALSQALSWEQVEPMFEMLQTPVLAKDIRALYGMTDASKFKKKYIDPFLSEGIFAMTKPDVPNSRLQKYYLTEKGLEILKSMRKR